jgi:hypothetical protein
MMFIRNLAKEMISPDAERAMTTGKGGVGVILGKESNSFFYPSFAFVAMGPLLLSNSSSDPGDGRN